MTGIAPIRITRDLRLMIASALDGGAASDHLMSVAGLVGAAPGRMDACEVVAIAAQGALDRARNALLGVFLASDATHLLLVDGAIGFDPAAVLGVIDLMQGDDAYAIVTAPCLMREVNWGLVQVASVAGLGDADPAELARFGGQFAFEIADPDGGLALDRLTELTGAEAGLMVIRRDVIEALWTAHPELHYAPDRSDLVPGQPPRMLTALFQSTVDPASNRLLSGAMLFSYRARAAGFRLWLAPWLGTTNTGHARFAATLADIAALDPPEADEPLTSHPPADGIR